MLWVAALAQSSEGSGYQGLSKEDHQWNCHSDLHVPLLSRFLHLFCARRASSSFSGGRVLLFLNI